MRPMVWGSESWVLSGYPERPSVLCDGPRRGMTLNELVCVEKEALVGRGVYARCGNEFPLLVKLLDVRIPLSIQVHPSEEFAMGREGRHGKAEMWYVLDADEGAELISGFAASIDGDEFERRVSDGSIADVVARHRIAKGDVFHIPPGRIHALPGGSRVAEIQQTSDTTYRIWDYGRPGLDGRLRPLHTALAREALDYRVQDSYRTPYTEAAGSEVPLVDCDCFTTSLLELEAPFRKNLETLDSFLVVLCLEGEVSVRSGASEMPLCEGGCILVPASAAAVEFNPGRSGVKLLLSHL